MIFLPVKFLKMRVPDFVGQFFLHRWCILPASLFVCLFIIHSVNPYMVKTTEYRICHYKLRQLGYKITIFTYNGLKS